MQVGKPIQTCKVFHQNQRKEIEEAHGNIVNKENKLRRPYKFAMKRLDNKGDILTKLYNPHIRSILFTTYGDYIKEINTMNIDALIKRLEAK